MTGASAGIGAEFARALARDGLSVVLTARREERLRELASELEKTYHVATRVVAADLADPAGPARVADAVADLEIAVLVNNAGFGASGRFEKLDPERLREMVQLNCLAPVLLTHRLLPGHARARARRDRDHRLGGGPPGAAAARCLQRDQGLRSACSASRSPSSSRTTASTCSCSSRARPRPSSSRWRARPPHPGESAAEVVAVGARRARATPHRDLGLVQLAARERRAAARPAPPGDERRRGADGAAQTPEGAALSPSGMQLAREVGSRHLRLGRAREGRRHALGRRAQRRGAQLAGGDARGRARALLPLGRGQGRGGHREGEEAPPTRSPAPEIPAGSPSISRRSRSSRGRSRSPRSRPSARSRRSSS